MSLRQRRRRQTALEIQAAALTLAQQQGFEQVTTEAIAAAAGVSPRTFFNYYPFKEAAILGPPPELPAMAVEEFTASHGPLWPDLTRLLKAYLGSWEGRRDTLRAMIPLTREHPRILALHQSALFALRDSLTGVIAGRLPQDPILARLLALVMLDSARVAMEHWLDEDGRLEHHLDQVLDRLPALGRLLSQQGMSGDVA